MADNEIPMFTTAQVFKMFAESAQYAADAIDNAGSLDEARAILAARVVGARDLAEKLAS